MKKNRRNYSAWKLPAKHAKHAKNREMKTWEQHSHLPILQRSKTSTDQVKKNFRVFRGLSSYKFSFLSKSQSFLKLKQVLRLPTLH